MTTEEFDQRIWPLMTEKEITEMLCCYMNGSPTPRPGGGIMILMGAEAMNRYYDYRKQMIDKYET